MSSFNLLSKQMQKKVWDMKWETFTPIQEKTIPIIINTDKDVVICSGTASGKTEAAFLPILSLVGEDLKNQLKVLYISPLKALINNQFERIERLCTNIDVPIHKWHGDVDQSKKNKLLKNPAGILQITPESLEAIFTNKAEMANNLFKNIDFIIIDEIHSFIGRERGVQLRSLIYRMENYFGKRPRIVALSATIDNFDLVKQWINYNDSSQVEILESKDSDKSLYYSLMFMEMKEIGKKPLELYEDIRELTRQYKSIIFCNSRGEVEEATVMLQRLADKEGAGESYYPHHSSIDKKEREYVEKVMATATMPKSVIATSSLELGIDIGEIALVVQIDSTYTVSSLKQRLGRSGRRKDSNQLLQLYATTKDDLIQSLAVMELLLEKWIEPADGYALPYDILFHQLISICNEANGLTYEDIMSRIEKIKIFKDLEKSKIEALIYHMVSKEYLEIIKGRNEYIVGLEGERILRSKDFYSVFMTPEAYEVINGNRIIGKIDKTPFVQEESNIILSGKLWTITNIINQKNKVYVISAANGKPPKYNSGGIKLNSKIPEKIMEFLCNSKDFNYINDKAKTTLQELRMPYKLHNVNQSERIIWIDKCEVVFETFTGTNVFKTLVWMLEYFGVKVKKYDGLGRITIENSTSLISVLHEIKNKQWTREDIIQHVKDTEWFQSKYSEYLPEELRIDMHMTHEVDIEGVKAFLETYSIREFNN